MPQIDHRVGEGFERVVQRTDALEAQQQTVALIAEGIVLIGPCADKKRWACPGDLKRRISRSRCRVGWCETSN